MDSRPELDKLLHDVQSKSASLKSAAQLLKGCPLGQARKMAALMTKEARDILRSLLKLEKELSRGRDLKA